MLFKSYAAELVGLSPNAILATTTPAAVALRQQMRSIPIVFALVTDPVGLGLVQSLSRPGGNITGFSSYDAAMMGKCANADGAPFSEVVETLHRRGAWLPRAALALAMLEDQRFLQGCSIAYKRRRTLPNNRARSLD
jgi:hypothetical protein